MNTSKQKKNRIFFEEISTFQLSGTADLHFFSVELVRAHFFGRTQSKHTHIRSKLSKHTQFGREGPKK